MNTAATITWDDATNLPANVSRIRDTAWVTTDGLGVCAECAYADIFRRTHHWHPGADAAAVFAAYGYERCSDEWCSVCDRDTPLEAGR